MYTYAHTLNPNPKNSKTKCVFIFRLIWISEINIGHILYLTLHSLGFEVSPHNHTQ